MSESGIIGRIVAGIRRKLRKVIVGGGVAASGGELADSSAALLAMIIENIHNFAMSSLGSIDLWTLMLQKDIEMCSVTKHAFHIKELREKLDAMKAYVQPIHDILQDIINPDSDLAVKTDPHVVRAIPSFERIFKGDDVTGAKGTKYWTERLEFYTNKVDTIQEIYVGKLNEQRNSFTFVLSIFTIVVWPFELSTGYWGQNFDNMYELYKDGMPQGDDATDPIMLYMQPSWHPEVFQGLNAFWIINGIMYFFVIFGMLHFRIFYTAS